MEDGVRRVAGARNEARGMVGGWNDGPKGRVEGCVRARESR